MGYTRTAQGRTKRRARDRAQRAAQIRAGTWRGMVPAAPARAHLDLLRAAGMNDHEIAKASGLSMGTIVDVRRAGRPLVHEHTASAILAVTPYCPGVAATRQVRALAVCGVSNATMARWGNVLGSLISRAKTAHGLVSPTTAAKIATAYRIGVAALMAAWPAVIVPGGSMAIREAALTAGWAGPLAWDEDTIGDPNAQPATGAEPTVQHPHTGHEPARVWLALAGSVSATELSTAERREVVTALAGWGWTDLEIGTHLRWGDTEQKRANNAQRCRRYYAIPTLAESSGRVYELSRQAVA